MCFILLIYLFINIYNILSKIARNVSPRNVRSFENMHAVVVEVVVDRCALSGRFIHIISSIYDHRLDMFNGIFRLFNLFLRVIPIPLKKNLVFLFKKKKMKLNQCPHDVQFTHKYM